MAVFGLCLSVLFVSVIVSTPIVHGRSLRRHHGHHSRPNYYDLIEESMSRDLPGERVEDDLVYGDSYRRKPEGHGYPRILTRLRNREPSRRQEDLRRYYDDDDDDDGGSDYETSSAMRLFARRKRHNKHGTVSYKTLTEEDKRDLMMSRLSDHEHELLRSGENDDLRASYELEVKEAQNSTICNYTVVSIPDSRGSRVPETLEHVLCNHVGKSCQGADPYCCIQTYKNIEVSYGDGYRETIKLYVGCVCAHQVLLRETPLPIDN